MNRKNTSKEMVATKNKNKVLLCSTPEHQSDSPSRDSDSVSEAASPVPFLCTQDGAEGETDVVWNFYTPKSENTATSRLKNSTPLSRKSKRSLRPKLIEKLPKRRAIKPSQKKAELFQDLIELNQNLQELISKKQTPVLIDKQSGSEEDMFSDSPDCSPKSIQRSSSRCLRKNVLSSNFGKPDPDTALESDDSMNECLLKASQIVEERILNINPVPAKRTRYSTNLQTNCLKTDINFKIDQDSMDAILNSIKLESPSVTRAKKCNSPCMNNDSFDSIVGNLNDSALEQLTQMPVKSDLKNKSENNPKDWTLKELIVHDNNSSLSKSFFGRHNTMPESPVVDKNQPSTSGMVFGRYNSMPYDQQKDKSQESGDSPIRCTPDEIKKKHQLAREKLLAKRQLPFTSMQSTQSTQQTQTKKAQFEPKKAQFEPRKAQFEPKKAQFEPKKTQFETQKIQFEPKKAQFVPQKIQFEPKKAQFQPKVASNKNNNVPTQEIKTGTSDIKSIIEKKRQEALMKLRRRQPQK